MKKHVAVVVRSLKWVLAVFVFSLSLFYSYGVSAQEEQPAKVTLHIAIDATRDNYPLMTTVLTAVVPASWPDVQGMRAHGVDEEEYSKSYGTLTSRFSEDGWEWDTSPDPAEFIRNIPVLTIQDEKATLVFSRSSRIYSIGLNSPQYYSGGVTIGSAINAGSAAPLFAPQDLLLHIEHTNSESVSMTHAIELEIKGLQIISATPIPKQDDGAKVVWVFEPGQPASDILVRLRPRLGTSLLLWSSLGFIYTPVRFIPGLIRSLSMSSIFIATLLIMRGRRRSQLDEVAQKAAGDVRYAAAWALALSLVIEFFFDIFRISRFFSNTFFDLTSFGVYFLLLLFWSASQPFSMKKLLRMAILSVLFLAQTAFEFFLFMNLFDSEPDLNRLDLLLTITGAWSLFILLRLGIITYLALAGIISFIIKLWPTGWPRWLNERKQDQAKIMSHLSASLVLLSFLIVFFWLAFQIQDLGGSLLFNFSMQSSENLSEVLSYAFQAVRDDSHNFAVNMLGSAGALLPFIALSGLLGLLHKLSRTSKNIYFSADQEWALSLAAILFAGFVVGTGGAFMGLSIPIGFLVALLLFRLTLSNRIGKAEQELRAINPGLEDKAPLLLGYRRELLQRARALENLSHQHAALYEEYTTGKLDEKSYEEKNTALQSEIERLTYGDDVVVSPTKVTWKTPPAERKKPFLPWLISLIFRQPGSPAKPQPPASLRLTKDISPNEIALSFGPGDNWWENASHAVDIGWKIALFPVVFYLYVLFSENALVWLSPQTDFGVFYLLSGLLREVVFWLTAAFVLGCMYPYLPGTNGVLKGAFLAGIWIVSILARELIGLGDDTGWIFRSLQLLMFLTLLGAGLDLQTLLRNGIYWRSILDYYQLRDVRTVVGYLSPLLLALIAIAQQLFSGQALDAITEIIKNLPQTIPLF